MHLCYFRMVHAKYVNVKALSSIKILFVIHFTKFTCFKRLLHVTFQQDTNSNEIVFNYMLNEHLIILNFVCQSYPCSSNYVNQKVYVMSVASIRVNSNAIMARKSIDTSFSNQSKCQTSFMSMLLHPPTFVCSLNQYWSTFIFSTSR